MIDRVLVPMDESDLAERALTYALTSHPDAEITVLHVLGGATTMMGEAMGLAMEDDVEAEAREQAAGVLDRAREIAADHGVEIETAVAFGKAGASIVSHADEYDLVVVGSHGGSLVDRLLVGNVAESVFRNSPVPVTVVR